MFLPKKAKTSLGSVVYLEQLLIKDRIKLFEFIEGFYS